MKLVYIDNKYTWKVIKQNDRYLGTCGRLGLKIEATSFSQLVDLAQISMYNLFKDQYEQGHLNDFAFKYSATYRIKDLEEFVELSVPLIVEDE